MTLLKRLPDTVDSDLVNFGGGGRHVDVTTNTRMRRPSAGAAPQRSTDFAHLSLDALRRYRAALNAEEGRVSYWRRIVQARVDVVTATEEQGVPAVSVLQEVLARPRVDTGRQVLMEVVPVDDMPPLPDLAELWHRDPVPGNSRHNAGLARDLTKAEGQLSAYRAALHQRISAATNELIARYRENPAQCLEVLPLGPARETRAYGA